MHYDLVDLRVFLAIAEEGSLSRGAARAHLAASSASLRLKGLEEALGVSLFVRRARGVALTAAGNVMLEHVRQCVAGLEQMHADLSPYALGLTTHLTFFANNNVVNFHLPDDLARFFAHHPSVRITLEERLGTDIILAVAQGRADIGVVAVDSDHPELDFLPYREDRFVLIVPPGSRLSRQASVRFADCFDQPWICLQNGSALHTYLMNQAASLGGRLDVRVQVASFDAVMGLVASGAGVSIVPASALEKQEVGRMVAVELTDAWAPRHHRVCIRKGAIAGNRQLGHLVATLCAPRMQAARAPMLPGLATGPHAG
ncbi:LysR family transcriptional regulator [Xylophilus sp. GOD-11R]|uniref:LysR family transcriptional regulator n=1 Tax=Xylophilus sp. GOD-11R TaxID=3089814 RepID=UPI00298C7872|nr:LysR family transcriptional regulator [Xylophilus sp. GOD-11R]WPB58272.1 LysR family transcriptional regulator [Xylophilus sp. GOD-11R]